MRRKKSSPRVIVPELNRIRSIKHARGFGWLDARILRDGWLTALSADDLAVYTFLCLVADRQGVSWYSRHSIRESLTLYEDEVFRALDRLEKLDLIAYRPFQRHDSEGFRQVLSVPAGGPPRLPVPSASPHDFSHGKPNQKRGR